MKLVYHPNTQCGQHHLDRLQLEGLCSGREAERFPEKEHLDLILDLQESLGRAHGLREEMPLHAHLALVDLVHVGTQLTR